MRVPYVIATLLLSLTTGVAGEVLYFPVFVNGIEESLGYRSKLTLLNTTERILTGTVTTYDQEGFPNTTEISMVNTESVLIREETNE